VRLLVVRHGHAEPKGTWNGEDAERPLVTKGRRQAQSLVKAVAQYRTARIISSPSLRCRQTVEPLAAARQLDVELSTALAPESGDAALELVRSLASGRSSGAVVLCTHREVIVEVLPKLAAESGVKLGHRVPGAKGALWVLDAQKGRFSVEAYIAPKR
jgi:phosphohistidine phosphatase SixA